MASLLALTCKVALLLYTTTTGLLQGSISSPFLFNLYMALSHIVLPRSVKILYYADDIAIFCSNQHLEFIKLQLNIALDNLYQFFTKIGLEIFPSKSNFTIFSTLKPRNLRILLNKHKFTLRVGNGNIQFSPTPRFLGVVLDSELNWKAHVNYLRNRIMPKINILKAITGIRWGAHPTNLLTIYKGYIRPLLDWGCQAFNPLNEQLYLKVCRLQYTALRTVSGLMITTPTNVLLDINGKYPLETRWFCLTLRFLSKITARRSHPLNLIITEILSLPDIENNNICNLIDTYIAHKELFKQIKHFRLPEYLDFPYECRHFKPTIDTDLGFQLIGNIDTNINDSFTRLISPLQFDALLWLSNRV